VVKIFLENVTKHFDDTVAVDDLTLEIRDKEFLVLLGPSGCGKTTVLNLIAGLEAPDKGHIYFDDELVDQLPPDKRDVAMVFQSYALYPHMNAYDNIAFPLKNKKFPKEEIRKRVLETASLLGIEHLLSRKPYQMSGGERQRVALARAIVREPKAFLLDEPLSNLDARMRISTRTELKKLHEDLEITFVYVTHDQLEAMTMGDRIVLMRYGTIQQIGTPNEVYNNPSNLFVASFIGSNPMNLLECVFVEQEGKKLLKASSFDVDVSSYADICRTIEAGTEVVLGLRPEDLNVSKSRTSENDIGGTIFAVEPLGNEAIIDVKVGDDIVKLSSSDLGLRKGERVWISMNYRKIHIFDKKSGKAII